ncbi:MAG: hypothetical protein QG577_455 [Thermodesulfobacteriota bacterium]|nr:hypothetical protein [Thermodesulfobacteriota bacterium]
MKKVLLIAALVVSLGIVFAMFGSNASARMFCAPMTPMIAGAGCCFPVCGPVYCCPTAPKAVKSGAPKAKSEKKEKKETKEKKEKK